MSDNRGKLLENVVFLEMVKAGIEIFYYKGDYECDFLIKKKANLYPIQVSWEMGQVRTKNRELRALVEVTRITGAKVAQIITFDQKLDFTIDDINIQIIPFYEWVKLMKTLY